MPKSETGWTTHRTSATVEGEASAGGEAPEADDASEEASDTE